MPDKSIDIFNTVSGLPIVQGYSFESFTVPQHVVLGDSQICASHYWIGVLGLYSKSGHSGIGFTHAVTDHPPEDSVLIAWLKESAMERLRGKSARALLNSVSVMRGGNRAPAPAKLDEAVDQALWDMTAKAEGVPLYRLLGGETRSVDAYASGLCFHFSNEDLERVYGRASQLGFTKFKVKVGDDNPHKDIERLKTIASIVPPSSEFMIDGNEAWTSTQAIHRIQMFKDAGFDIRWVEDPVLRHDFEGLRHIHRALPGIHLNAGEYLRNDEKLELISQRCADLLCLQGHISAGLKLAWVAQERGLSVALGNSAMNIGAHLAAALATPFPVEHSFLIPPNEIVSEIQISNGNYTLPDCPGHGIHVASKTPLFL